MEKSLSNHWPPNFDWVLPTLAVGGRIREEHVERLATELRICRVVDLRSEERDDVELFTKHRIAFLHLPTPDTCAVDLDLLHAGVEWVNAALEAEEKVLIHCEHGIGRSALLAACVLVSRGCQPCAALEKLKTSRWKISPSPEQLERLLLWSKHLYAGRGMDCPTTTWDDLAAIAYRHLPGRCD